MLHESGRAEYPGVSVLHAEQAGPLLGVVLFYHPHLAHCEVRVGTIIPSTYKCVIYVVHLLIFFMFVLVPPIRYYYYSMIKMQYFLYDFCYFTNILSVVTMHTYDVLPSLFRVVFIFCNGPLSWAVVIWRNSLVYHDFDRMTSIYIHILPAMLSFCVRWYGLSPENAAVTLQFRDFVHASIMYLFWQFLYYYKTEVQDKAFLDANPEVVTSLRWLASDKKNGMARFVLNVCRKAGIFAKDEDYNPAEFKTLMVFMVTQFIYTVVTMLPVPFIFNSFPLQICFISFIFTCVVYNGASYYIEVFSKRYQLKFAKKEDMQMVVQAAAEIAYEVKQTLVYLCMTLS